MALIQKDIEEEEFAEYVRWKERTTLNNRIREIQGRYNSTAPKHYTTTEFLRGLPPNLVEMIFNVYNPVPHQDYRPPTNGRVEGYYDEPYDINGGAGAGPAIVDDLDFLDDIEED
jgi:hypothetical protein